MAYGVPQGSFLGPLLHTLYIYDLPSVIQDCKVVLYTDDTALFATGLNLAKVQKDLNVDLAGANRWLQENKVTLNATRAKCMLYRTTPGCGESVQRMFH